MSNAEAMKKILETLKEKLGSDWEVLLPPQGIRGLSLNGLKERHKAVFDAVATDDSIPTGHDKPFGVREFPDWKTLSDQLEAELTKRKEPFHQVPW